VPLEPASVTFLKKSSLFISKPKAQTIGDANKNERCVLAVADLDSKGGPSNFYTKFRMQRLKRRI
jgi:hypothetical protein